MSTNKHRMPDVSRILASVPTAMANMRGARNPQELQFQNGAEASSAIMRIAEEVGDTKEVVAEMLKAWSGFARNNGDLSARLVSVEQAVAGGQGGPSARYSDLTPGEEVIRSDEYRALASSQSGKIRINATTLTTGSSSGGALGPADRKGYISSLARRRPRFREALAQGTTNSSLVEYVRQTTRTNAAAMQVEGSAKAEGALAFELVQTPVRTLAVLLPASKQVLDDAPMLRSIIDNELRYMLQDAEEIQLLSGDGTGVNLTGIIPGATAYSAPFAADGTETMIDTLLLAMAQLEALNYEATYIALNPIDWRRMQSLKDDQARYQGNGPFGAEQIERLWSTPVIPTQAMTIDKFLIGDGQRGAMIYDRQDPTIEVSTEHADFFAKNLVMIRAEERLALAIPRPGAHIYGDLGNVS